ncbi:MAG TPA: aspartate-semialdehyde dehydrogenase [Armatimonadetes bacterium]|nr:aspartate-semialdehyde dehydrogenase [Armatimonadota bacterium]
MPPAPARRIVVMARRPRTISVEGERFYVRKASIKAFGGIDIALFAGGEVASAELGWPAVEKGAVVIDNSATFRLDPEVPLVVPEVNPHQVERHKGLIANPNCSTIQMVVALKPLHDLAKAKRVVVSTYQSVSGTGREAVEELRAQVRAIASGRKPKWSVYPHQIAFNLIPEIGSFDEEGYSSEERKMERETQKIMEEPIEVTATTVRVPVYIGHAEAVNIEFQRKITAEEAREALSKAPGIRVVDDPKGHEYPMPLFVAGRDEVFVGRIREDKTVENGLWLWVVADNLRKGAALNAVQIAELMIEKGLI